MSTQPSGRPPLRIVGILFAFALNLLLVSLAYFSGFAWAWSPATTMTFMLVASFVAGAITTLYVGARSGIHAFLGGFLSVPVLALFVFEPGNWNPALLAGGFCALGGILGEFLHRRRR